MSWSSLVCREPGPEGVHAWGVHFQTLYMRASVRTLELGENKLNGELFPDWSEMSSLQHLGLGFPCDFGRDNNPCEMEKGRDFW